MSSIDPRSRGPWRSWRAARRGVGKMRQRREAASLLQGSAAVAPRQRGSAAARRHPAKASGEGWGMLNSHTVRQKIGQTWIKVL